MIDTGMEVPVRVLLQEYTSSSSERGVSHDEEGLGCISHFDYWGGKECFF